MDLYTVTGTKSGTAPQIGLKGFDMSWMVLAESKAHAKALVHEQFGLDMFDSVEVILDGRSVIPAPECHC